MSATSPLQIVDFHNHYVGPSFTPTVPNRALVDPAALLASTENGVAMRVVSTPLEFLRDKDSSLPPGIISKINDTIAELVGRHPGKLYGLATVDAFGGDESARELTRGVRELGLRGVFVESARDNLLPDAPEARPIYAAAAALDIPIFIHPIEDAALFSRFKHYGRHGVRLTRGTINATALFALLESGMFEEFAGLQVVATSLALGGVLLAAGTAEGARLRKETPTEKRRHVYLDTTGLDAAAIRCAVDLVGADHVVMGTDWPVVFESTERIRSALDACGLDAAQQELIAAGNTLRRLKLTQ